MTRETAQKLLPVIQAFAEGKTIQYRLRSGPEGHWETNVDPEWDRNCDYRIKPREPREFTIVRNLIDNSTVMRGAEQMLVCEQIRVREILDEPETGKGEA